jgi:spore coat-associated protein N
MKKLLFTLMAVVLCLGLVGGAFAYFSDTETSTGNTFTAGTLDLTVDDQDDPNVTPALLGLTIGPLAPGDSNYVIVNVTNNGDIDGQLSVLIGTGIPWDVTGTMVQTEGANPESETGNTADPGELADYLVFDVQYDANNDDIFEDEGWPNWGPGSVFPTFASCNGETLDFGTLGAGLTRHVKISWSLPSSVGNDIQGDIVTYDITFCLTQVH